MTQVTINFDWEKAPEASVEGMTVYFFPESAEAKLWRFDIEGHAGGVVEIPPGDYRMIAVNNDLRGVTFTGTDIYNEFSACGVTLPSSPATLPTGILYGATVPSVNIGYNKVTYFNLDRDRIISGNSTIVMTPDSLSTVYHLRLDGVSNCQRIRSARAIIYGVAKSVNIASCVNSADTCCMETSMALIAPEGSMLEGTGTAFGCPDIGNPQFYLEVVIGTQRGLYRKKYDVTHQVLNSFSPRNVFINIEGFDIPDIDPNPSQEGNVQMDVGVDGWTQFDIIYTV